MSLNDFLNWLKGLIETLAPALAVILWNYEESKIVEAKHEALDANVKLELEKNHESIESKYSGHSDIDIINDAITSAGGELGEEIDPISAPASTDKPGTKK